MSHYLSGTVTSGIGMASPSASVAQIITSIFFLTFLVTYLQHVLSIRYSLISGSRISTLYHIEINFETYLTPFHLFILLVHSFTSTYNLPTTTTDPSRLALSRRS